MQKASASRSRSRNGRGGGDRDRDDSPDASMQNDSMQSDTPGFPLISSQFTPAQLAQQAAANKPNKGVILTKSVEYIRYLQQLVQMQAERNRELEIRVRLLESGGSSHLPPSFNPAAASGGTCVPINTTTNGLVGSPGIPLGSGGSMRSLPPLEEGENAMDEGTGLSHKRDQFTARRSASRNSMNANDQPVLQQLPKNMHVETGKKTSPLVEPLPRQDILTTQDWIDSQLAAEMQDDSNNSQQDQQSNKMNGITTNGQQNNFIASPTISSTTSTTMLMMQNGHAHLTQQHQQHQDEHDNHQMTFEDLLQVGRNNRVISDSEGRDSLASESPLPSVGKMEEDDENALGMQL